MHMGVYSLMGLAMMACSVVNAATTCNGHPELCSKTFADVTVVGAHNSYTNSSTNLAANQDYDVTQQLNDGVRLLQNQVHLNNGALRLCHTSCVLYDGGSLTDYLTKVKKWMDANPTEVVSILWVNIDNQPAASFQSIYSSVGLESLSYSPPEATVTNGNWPTYGTLIDAGTRLVSFMDNSADFGTVPYLIDEFSNMWETAFDVTDSNFNCTIDRFTGTTDGQMYLINHYLYKTSDFLGGSTLVPNKDDLTTTNAASGAGSLGAHVDTCKTEHTRPPTFLLVDFYEYGGGSVFEVAATVNGVTYSPSTPIASTPTATTSSTATSTAKNSGSSNLPGGFLVSGYLTGLATLVFGALPGSLFVL